MDGEEERSDVESGFMKKENVKMEARRDILEMVQGKSQ